MTLKQYQIFKFKSDRLRKPILITIDEARRNDEIITLGDSQVLRTIRAVRKIKHDETFIPDIISVVVVHISHYDLLATAGFVVNGKRYVRFYCGSGNARQNTVVFIQEDIEQEAKTILQCGYNAQVKLVPSKYNAYFALAASATIPVTSPRIAVIPDCEVRRKELVDFIYTNNEVVEEEHELDFNYFDGMGIISPHYARQWARELQLDYLPSAFCVRNAWTKGMVCVIDFHAFAMENGRTTGIDVWGNPFNILETDMVLTASQFKLWAAYNSLDDFIKKTVKYNWRWGISRVTPKVDKTYTFLNYQFVQVLNLNEQQIRELCQPTIDWVSGVIHNKDKYALLYLSGGKSFDVNDTQDVVSKAIAINSEIINDPYVKNHIYSSLSKKIRESYIGKLLVDGNFQVMISDPYAFMEHLCGMPVVGLLKRDEHYAQYWNERGVNAVAAMRAPLTWRSEVNKLNLCQTDLTKKWFKYLYSGIVYNIHGNDCMLHADSDFDFDIVCSTNNPTIISGIYGGLPITYDKKSAPKKIIDENELYKYDVLSFNSKIGFITNLSTTMYSMLAQYTEGSPEHVELIRRLKLCRMHQGNQIDKTKGIQIPELPKEWTTKTGDELSDKLIIEKRPYFMRYLYDDYNRDYKNFISEVNSYFRNTTDNEYLGRNPLIESKCVMNILCKYMESIDFKNKEEFDYNVLLSNKNTEKLMEIYKKFRDSKYENYDKHCSEIRKLMHGKVSDMAVNTVYPRGNKDFVWKVFYDGLIENISLNSSGRYEVPLISDTGQYVYMGSKYNIVGVEQ